MLRIIPENCGMYGVMYRIVRYTHASTYIYIYIYIIFVWRS